MNGIIEFPQAKKLREDVERLKQELLDLVTERDELKFNICKNIKMDYMLEIGYIEYKVYEKYCEYARLRRKKELIQARKNRGEEVDIEEIDRLLDIEFEDYIHKLNEKIRDIKEAIERSKLESLSKEETKDLKRMYKELVKKLHPDLHPDLTEEQLEMFYQVVDAYEVGDIITIKILYNLVGASESLDSSESTLDKLVKEKSNLEKIVEEIKMEVEHIKTTPPYIFKYYLDDEEKKKVRIKELEEISAGYDEAITILKAQIKEMLVK